MKIRLFSGGLSRHEGKSMNDGIGGKIKDRQITNVSMNETIFLNL